MNGMAVNRWVTGVARASARGNALCLPFAGGGASFYRAWAPLAPAGVAIRPVQLPGREERMGERPIDRMAALVQAAADGMMSSLDTPYVLFGHSMGALVAFELAHALRERGAPPPVHLFVSGSPSPKLAELVTPIFQLPGEQFFEAVRHFGGLPDEVLRSPELIALLMPRLRADLAVTGTYRHT